MSQEEIKKYTVIQDSLEGKLSVKEAAAALNLSKRQVIRLRNGVREKEPHAIVHQNQGRPPAHTIPEDLRRNIISLKLSDLYQNANFKHFQELIEKHEGIKVSYSTLYGILTQANIQSPKKRRRFKPHRRRKRKLQEGLLLQMDASPFPWLGGKAMYSLHGSIDDATGKITGLYLTKHECLHGYFEVIHQTLIHFGIPISLYCDRHAIFLSTHSGKLTVEDQLQGKVCNDTQFGRAMKELGVTIIPARSPQAKGRVERLWETLQSRLPVELKIAGVKTIEEANEFLKTYLFEFNSLFAVEPEKTESAFRLLENIDLAAILCVKQKRRVDAGGVFSFYGKQFKVVTENLPAISTPTSVLICIHSITGVRVEYKGRIYPTIPFLKPPKAENPEPKEKKVTVHVPPDNHYYKYGQHLVKRISFDETDQEILDMPHGIFLGKYKKLA